MSVSRLSTSSWSCTASLTLLAPGLEKGSVSLSGFVANRGVDLIHAAVGQTVEDGLLRVFAQINTSP